METSDVHDLVCRLGGGVAPGLGRIPRRGRTDSPSPGRRADFYGPTLCARSRSQGLTDPRGVWQVRASRLGGQPRRPEPATVRERILSADRRDDVLADGIALGVAGGCAHRTRTGRVRSVLPFLRHVARGGVTAGNRADGMVVGPRPGPRDDPVPRGDHVRVDPRPGGPRRRELDGHEVSHGRFGPRPCSARASAVTGFAVFSTLKPEPRRLVHTLVNSAPRRRICAE
jgi:hypothetical protein